MIKIYINKNGREYWANGDKVFSWLYERYVKSEGRKTKGKIVPYSQKLNNFFKEIILDEQYLSDMGKAFPGINIKNELDKAKMWLISNKSHKKDLKKFCYNWIARANPTMIAEGEKNEEALEVAREGLKLIPENPIAVKTLKEIDKITNKIFEN